MNLEGPGTVFSVKILFQKLSYFNFNLIYDNLEA